MKKVLKKFNRTLSIMLAAAMVLTMVPQTAMPVLAAENEVVETQGEAPVDDITPADEDDESADVGETENPVNSGVSEPTEGEQEEGTEGEETPVIDEENNSEEDQEQIPDVEEDPIETPEEENPAEETGEDSSVLDADLMDADAATKPAAPVITVKYHGNKVDPEKVLPNRAENVTFEIKAVEGTTFRYTLGNTELNDKDSGLEYSEPVEVLAPVQDTAGTATIKAIAVITSENGNALISDVTTVEIKFAAQKTISLSNESEDVSSVAINVGGWSNGTDYSIGTPYPITDPEQRHYVHVRPKDSETLVEVMYIGEGEGDKWTSAYEEEEEGYYRIPNDRLNENLQIKVVNMRKITLTWEGDAYWSSVEMSASAFRSQTDNPHNLIVFGDRLGYPYENKIYAPKDTKVALTVSPIAGRNIQLSRVALAKGTEAAVDQTIDAKGTANFVVSESITDDYKLTIDGSGENGSYQQAVLKDTQDYDGEDYREVVPDKNKNYSVVPNRTYELSARKSGGELFSISKVTVSENSIDSNVITPTTGEDGDGTLWQLEVKEDASNKTLKVGIYDGKVCVDTLTLKVAPVTTGVTIKGEKEGKITQQIGTEAKYALTLDNQSKGSKDELDAKIKSNNSEEPYVNANESVRSVAVDNGSLVVRTSAAAKANAKAAEIVIINSANGKVLKTVTLETLAPAWDTSNKNGGVAPTLKQAGATDTSLTVDITAPKGAVFSDEEDVVYYYEVKFNKKGEATKTPKYVEATAATTHFTFNVSDQAPGKGAKADYEVTAQLCLRTGSFNNVDTQPTGTSIAASKVSAVLKHATRDVYYADKITMKKEKAASALYTGQKAHVATVDFGKNASYNSGVDVEIYDIPEGLSVQDADGNMVSGGYGETAVLADNLKVIVRAEEYVIRPGKYTIKARTTYNKNSDNAGSSIVQATASIPVTVVQGIYGINATAPRQIYTAGKGATAKIAVTYNYGENTPKTKKVTYDLVEYYGSDEVVTVPGITVNNGTIKVDKSYQVKRTSEENTYAVRVKAADYAGNETADYVEFEVTGAATRLGEVAIVRQDWQNDNYVDLTPKSDGEEIAINKLDGAQVVVVKPNRNPVHGRYTLDDFVGSDLYTLTIPRGIEANAYNELHPTKIGKNLVIKATASDGSKASVSSKKFTIVYDDSVPANEARVSYEANLDFVEESGFLTKSGTDTLTKTPAGTVITLCVTDKYGNELGGSVFDYVLSAKNAKVVKKYDGGLSLDVIVTKNPATITLKKGRTEVGVYNIEIPQLGLDSNKTKELNDKTPKISLKKGTKIYPNTQEQELAFTMNKAVEGARFVKVSCQDHEDDTLALYDALYDTTAILNATDKEFSFDFNLSRYYDQAIELKKGASFAFVFLDRDGEVLTKTTNTVKIKTTALKKSYKLDAKYTLSTKDAFRVPLTGKKSSVIDVTFTKLYNANIKGKTNKFREGFKLVDDGLELVTYYDTEAKDTKAVAEKADWTKNDFTGFVEYTVTYEDNTEEEFVTKIQVDLKKTDRKGIVPTAKKYAASAVSVLNPGANGTTEGVSYVTTGKVNADIRAAKIIYDSKATEADKGVEVKKVSGNEITFTVKGNARNMAYNKGKIYVIPLSGMYAYDNGYMNWEDADWQKYGIELKLNVSLKAANSKGKIKSPAKSVSFLNVAPKKLALDGVGKEYYYAELPYTAGIFAQIDDKDDKITLVTKNNPTKDPAPFAELEAGLIKVRKVSNKNALGIYIDAEAFKAAVNDNGKWSGATFPKIEMTVHFVGEAPGTKPNQYTAAPPESFTFSLTMPNPWSAISTNESRLVKVIAAMNGANAKIDGIASSSYDALEREVLVIANEPDVVIKDAVDAKKEAMVDELLRDATIDNWVTQLDSFKVVIDWNDSTQLTREISKGSKTNKQFLIDVVDAYTERLIRQLGNDNATWGELAGDNGRTIELNIAAKSKTGTTEDAYCNVTFKVDEEAGKDNLDRAIARAVKRMTDEHAIHGITGRYYSATNRIAITGNNPEMDFIDSKNQGRDKTIEILLSELGEYMDEVEQIEFAHQHEDIRDSITVKREGRDATEQYIADLVDKWTDKLVDELADGYEDDGNPNAYGRLRGEKLFVTATFESGATKEYTIEFDCPELLTGLDSAISSAVAKLNRADRIPGVSYIDYNASTKTIAITGDDANQDIIESKNAGRESTVRILLEEMEGYMNEVSEVTFTHHEENVRDSITVKREDHESTETYISDLVDEWTKKLAGELTSQGKAATYGSLDGKALEMTVSYSDTERPKRTYTISFTI